MKRYELFQEGFSGNKIRATDRDMSEGKPAEEQNADKSPACLSERSTTFNNHSLSGLKRQSVELRTPSRTTSTLTQDKQINKLAITPESQYLTVFTEPQIKQTLPYIQEIGHFMATEHFLVCDKLQPSYLLLHTRTGEGVVEYDDKVYHVLAGQVVWLDCMKPCCYYHTGGEKIWEIQWVYISGNSCKEHYNLFLTRNSGRNIVTLPPSNDVVACFRDLMMLHSDGTDFVYSSMRTTDLLEHLMMECCCATLRNLELLNVPKYILDASYYIQQNFRQKITLDTLAKQYAIDKYHFQKLFKQCFGYTPKQLLIWTRLNYAKNYLRTSDMSIGEISLNVGIENTSHFINLFKIHEGITPTVYRKRWYRPPF